MYGQDPQPRQLRFLLGLRRSGAHRIPKVSQKWRPAFAQVTATIEDELNQVQFNSLRADPVPSIIANMNYEYEV